MVDDVVGAGGNIAFNQLAKATPDGYTLGLAAAGNIVINQYLYKNMPFDPLKDLVVASPIGSAPQLVMVPANSPFKTLRDLVEYARQHPGDIQYGSAGVGTTLHLSGALLEKLTGVRLTHVPYRGSAPAITDLLGGRLQMVAIGAQPVTSFIKSGQLRALAVTDAQRLPQFPDVPTAAEAGVPGYEVSSWFALYAPKGVPEPVLARLDGLVKGMLNDQAERKRLDDAAIIPLAMSREAFQMLVDKEARFWGDFIRDAGIVAE